MAKNSYCYSYKNSFCSFSWSIHIIDQVKIRKRFRGKILPRGYCFSNNCQAVMSFSFFLRIAPSYPQPSWHLLSSITDVLDGFLAVQPSYSQQLESLAEWLACEPSASNLDRAALGLTPIASAFACQFPIFDPLPFKRLFHPVFPGRSKLLQDQLPCWFWHEDHVRPQCGHCNDIREFQLSP